MKPISWVASSLADTRLLGAVAEQKGTKMKTKKSAGNVFADLGFHGEEAENLRIRALLMAEAEQFIKRKGLSQAQAAARMGVSQPRISDLVRGKIGVFSVDSLIAMLSAVGLKVSVRVLKNKAA